MDKTPRDEKDFQAGVTKYDTEQFTKSGNRYLSHAEAARGFGCALGMVVGFWLLAVVIHCVIGAVL